MEDITIKFTFKHSEVKIQAKRNEYLKDIFNRYAGKSGNKINELFFLFNGVYLNGELKLEEINKKDNELLIVVYELHQNDNEQDI